MERGKMGYLVEFEDFFEDLGTFEKINDIPVILLKIFFQQQNCNELML
jgi:uncharacterized protein YkvS